MSAFTKLTSSISQRKVGISNILWFFCIKVSNTSSHCIERNVYLTCFLVFYLPLGSSRLPYIKTVFYLNFEKSFKLFRLSKLKWSWWNCHVKKEWKYQYIRSDENNWRPCQSLKCWNDKFSCCWDFQIVQPRLSRSHWQ